MQEFHKIKTIKEKFYDTLNKYHHSLKIAAQQEVLLMKLRQLKKKISLNSLTHSEKVKTWPTKASVKLSSKGWGTIVLKG